jgi:hypothetical protein
MHGKGKGSIEESVEFLKSYVVSLGREQHSLSCRTFGKGKGENLGRSTLGGGMQTYKRAARSSKRLDAAVQQLGKTKSGCRVLSRHRGRLDAVSSCVIT